MPLNAQTVFDHLLRLDPAERTIDLEVWDAELGIWLTLAIADIQEQAMAQGIPVLRGPYVVDYTDIPHDGDAKPLWTAAAGDIVVWAGIDASTLTNWDQGQVNVDQGGSNDILSLVPLGPNVTIPPVLLTAGAVSASWHTAGTDATTGHVEFYVLVARAIAP